MHGGRAIRWDTEKSGRVNKVAVRSEEIKTGEGIRVEAGWKSVVKLRKMEQSRREKERATWEELEHNYPLINSYNIK